MSKSVTTQATSFSLVYRAEAMVPIEIMVLLALLVLASKFANSHDSITTIEALDKRRHGTKSRWLSYQKQISRAYNKKVRLWTFTVGVLV